ncbi:hypothetical protein J4422_03955 [Candidatus Pacearchaeota archaeon]|nr:hypothetical protein [Candidatus Pacearchaeota archaeon]
MLRALRIGSRPKEVEGEVLHISHRYNPLIGEHSVLLVQEEEGFNVRPLIFYSTERFGKFSLDSHNKDLDVGDNVKYILNAQLNEDEKRVMDIYCPTGFFPVFHVSKVSPLIQAVRD